MLLHNTLFRRCSAIALAFSIVSGAIPAYAGGDFSREATFNED